MSAKSYLTDFPGSIGIKDDGKRNCAHPTTRIRTARGPCYNPCPVARPSTLLLLLPLLTVIACDETAVVVAIHSKLKIPAELDAICLQLAAAGKFQHGRRYALSEDEAGTPLTLTVLPGDRSQDGFEVLLRGERRGWEVSWVRQHGSFEEHAIRTEDVYVQRCGGLRGQGSFTWVQQLTDKPNSAVASVPVATAPGQVMVVWSSEARRFAYLEGMKQVPGGLPTVGQGPVRDLLAVDVDGDCDLDLVLLQDTVGPELWRHGSDGTFQKQEGAILVQGDFHHLATADLNLDGFADLVLVSPTEVKLLLNNGQGTGNFRDASSMLPATGLDDVTDVGIGFINRGGASQIDAYPDIVLARGNTTQNTALALINNYKSSDSLSFDRVEITDARQARSVAVADVNDDGLHDVVLGNVTDKALVYINNSDASAVKLALKQDALKNVSSDTVDDVLALDLDADCDVDIVLARGTDTVVYLNEGKGAFAEAGSYPAASRLAAADLDGDGVLDLVLGGGAAGAGWLTQGKLEN